jgi:hypothetical protein
MDGFKESNVQRRLIDGWMDGWIKESNVHSRTLIS